MASDPVPRFYRALYARLIGLYPHAHRARFGEAMMQTFTDICRARGAAGGSIAAFVAWTCVETVAGAVREHVVSHTAAMYVAALAVMYVLVVSALGLEGDLVAPLYLGALAVILLGGGIAFVETRRHPFSFRAGAALALGVAFLMSWANPAVGMIGNESNQANLIFLAVLAVGLIGALRARFQPRGTAIAMFATAAAQLAVGLFCFVAALPLPQIHNTAFAMLWALAGVLMLRGAQRPAPSQPAA